MQSGRHTEGLPYLLRGRDGAREVGDLAGWTAAIVNIANTYRELGDFETAKTHYLDAVKATEETGRLTSLALPLWNLISLSRATNDLQAASGYFKRLRSIPWDDLPVDLKRELRRQGLGW
jgi:hypothetical protein